MYLHPELKIIESDPGKNPHSQQKWQLFQTDNVNLTSIQDFQNISDSRDMTLFYYVNHI